VKTKTVDVAVDGKTGKYFKGVLKDVLGNVLANKEILIFYTAKTNKKGIASVNIKLAKKGTYKVAVKFAGDTTYNKVTKKITLKIK